MKFQTNNCGNILAGIQAIFIRSSDRRCMHRQEEFGYSGFLIFRPLLSDITQTRLGEHLSDETRPTFPTFEEGKPNNPSSGFVEIPIYDYYLNNNEFPTLEALPRDIDLIRYKEESYKRINAVDEDRNPVEAYELETNECDILNIENSVGLIRGKNSIIPTAKRKYQKYRTDPHPVNTARLSHEFLTKLLLNPEDALDNGVQIKSVVSVTYEGAEGVDRMLAGGQRDTHSLERVAPERNEKVSNILAEFDFYGREIQADIGTKDIHIRAEGAIEDLDDARRFVTAVDFVYYILNQAISASMVEI